LEERLIERKQKMEDVERGERNTYGEPLKRQLLSDCQQLEGGEIFDLI